MKKIPTIYLRDFAQRGAPIMPSSPNPECAWVFDGEGVPTVKWDGTSCLVRDGKLFKRRELRVGDTRPDNFEEAGFDIETRKTVGWVPVGEGSEDKYHREAWACGGDELLDGTYELIGPKVNCNPHNAMAHCLVAHGAGPAIAVPVLTYNDIRAALEAIAFHEGVVWHHPDGRMAKIKRRDLGLPWPLKGRPK